MSSNGSKSELDTTLDIRCFCKHRPLLAVAGRNRLTNKPFVHVRVIKNKVIHADVVIESGLVRLHCRDCYRWQTVVIRDSKVESRSEPLPDAISV